MSINLNYPLTYHAMCHIRDRMAEHKLGIDPVQNSLTQYFNTLAANKGNNQPKDFQLNHDTHVQALISQLEIILTSHATRYSDAVKVFADTWSEMLGIVIEHRGQYFRKTPKTPAECDTKDLKRFDLYIPAMPLPDNLFTLNVFLGANANSANQCTTVENCQNVVSSGSKLLEDVEGTLLANPANEDMPDTLIKVVLVGTLKPYSFAWAV